MIEDKNTLEYETMSLLLLLFVVVTMSFSFGYYYGLKSALVNVCKPRTVHIVSQQQPIPQKKVTKWKQSYGSVDL